jgi:hypothetical protein
MPNKFSENLPKPIFVSKTLVMVKNAAVLLVFLLALNLTGISQTLKIKCNSAENLHLVLVGSDNLGHKTTKVIYDVSQGYRKKFSLFKEKYGYDMYNNSKMSHEPSDSTSEWTELHVYDKSNTMFSKVDLTKSVSKLKLDKSGIWVRVKRHTERDYLLTEVVINDPEL